MEGSTGGFRVVSRRAVRPESASSPDVVPSEAPRIMQLTPWDLQYISVHYIQMGVLLPKKIQATAGSSALADELASSFARALGRFYPLAGRFVVTEMSGACLTVSLCSNNDGAEFVHAVAPEVSVSDVTTPRYFPPVLRSFFPWNGMLCGDAMLEPRPVVAAQVAELADGMFVALSLNHAAADGTTFWHLFNTWSEIHRSGGHGCELSMPPPVLGRWFPDTCPVPVTLPFRNVEDIVRRVEVPPHYMGSAVARGVAKCTVAHVLRDKGLGCEAWLLTQVVASFDEAKMRDALASWHQKPHILYPEASGDGDRDPADIVVASSTRFDVYGNSPEALARLTVDREFMEVVDMA
ncbi:unnamed protein product [Miscanthus lutarioriparius]|uniref:HXXXD-type acyl-transferase family protein n=1 Tax=Miscanthus lutarioriparius TaxID=422564 RepID=A0A811NSG4_9POAL|nr:unnamed protein product [Miscanthus lutarioriparius]